MTKITKNWINRDFNDPNGLTAADIPVSQAASIKKWLDLSGGIEPVDVGGRSIPQTVLYASPNGIGTGESSDTPISLETLRQRFSGRKVSVLIKLVVGGEYVLDDTWVVTNGARVFIEFDTSNSTLDWVNNPPIICTAHTTASYISYNTSDNQTCAAHNYDETAFSVYQGRLNLQDVVLRSTSYAVTVGVAGVVYFRNHFRIEMWAPKASVNNVCYAVSAMGPGATAVFMPRGNAASFDDRCGIYMYPTEASDQCHYYKAVAIASHANCMVYDGHLNFYSAHAIQDPSVKVDSLSVWNTATLTMYGPIIKHTNFKCVVGGWDSVVSFGEYATTEFVHDYDPGITDHRNPIQNLLRISNCVVNGILGSNNTNNTHYTTGSYLNLKNSFVGIRGTFPPFAAIGTVNSGVYCNAVTGRLAPLQCVDTTYGTYNIPVFAVHSSNVMIDYENTDTVTMNGDPNSPYSAFVAAYASKLELNGNPSTPTVYHTNKQQAGLFDVLTGSELFERASDIKLVTG